jgi:hypothetical protein
VSYSPSKQGLLILKYDKGDISVEPTMTNTMQQEEEGGGGVTYWLCRQLRGHREDWLAGDKYKGIKEFFKK